MPEHRQGAHDPGGGGGACRLRSAQDPGRGSGQRVGCGLVGIPLLSEFFCSGGWDVLVLAKPFHRYLKKVR